MDNSVLVIVAFVILAIVGLLLLGVVIQVRVCEKLFIDIKNIGYKNTRDVQIFCERIDASLEDFIESPGLRKQYELFRDGHSSDFIKQAELNKQKSDAESDGFVAGFVTGNAMGNVGK